MEIEIHNGFLGLHSARQIEILWVKGSSITVVAQHTIAGRTTDATLGESLGSLVTIGDSGWAVQVMDAPGDILLAIAESYKQARAR